METPQPVPAVKKTNCLFKSHYVVWKLCIPLIIRDSSDFAVRFKSHYVVWKRSCAKNKNKKLITFKSHYVVWKQRIP